MGRLGRDRTAAEENKAVKQTGPAGRGRILGFVALSVVCLTVAGGYASVSPDGKRIAFKQRVSGGGVLDVKWRLSVLSLDSLADHPLAETRNVDDQAEWLHDATVLYSVESDIYAVAADGSGAPRLFTRRADSPAVVGRSG